MSINKTKFAQEKQQRDPWDVLAALIDASIESLNVSTVIGFCSFCCISFLTCAPSQDGDNSQEQQQQSIAGDADAEATQVDRQETPSIGAEKVSGRVIEVGEVLCVELFCDRCMRLAVSDLYRFDWQENGGLSTIRCMYCGLSDYQIRSGDGSEARLVQHRENACGHLLPVCDRCVRKCTGKRRLQCVGCGNKVKSVAVIGHRNASTVGPIHVGGVCRRLCLWHICDVVISICRLATATRAKTTIRL